MGSVVCDNCGVSFVMKNGMRTDDCPACGRTVYVGETADAVEVAVARLESEPVSATFRIRKKRRVKMTLVETDDLRTLLTALREAKQQNSEQALNIVTMTHMHDALRKSVEMQAEEIKRLRGTILRYLDPADMSVGSVRDLLDAVKDGRN